LSIATQHGVGRCDAARQETLVEKDTVTFAIMLSVIDFFLSMVMISGIGVVLSLLPYLNRLGKLDEESMRRGH
jgi:hypothetical protein